MYDIRNSKMVTQRVNKYLKMATKYWLLKNRTTILWRKRQYFSQRDIFSSLFRNKYKILFVFGLEL